MKLLDMLGKYVLVLSVLSGLVACGDAPVSTTGTTTSAVAGSTTGTIPTTTTPGNNTGQTITGGGTMVLSLTDPNTGATRTSIAPGSPALVTVKITDGAGLPVSNASVNFKTDAGFGVVTTTTSGLINAGTSNVAVTNTSGVASASLDVSSIPIAGSSSVSVASDFGAGAIPYDVLVGTVTIALTDAASGVASSALNAGSPLTITSVVKDAKGNPVQNQIVQFATGSAALSITGLAKVSPAAALTDVYGKATSTLTADANTPTGADMLNVKLTMGKVNLSSLTTYTVGAVALTVSAPTFGIGTGSLAANGTTSVNVDVYANGVLVTTPTVVNFASGCAAIGKASLTSQATTVSGTATASYLDQGCAGSDKITATVGTTSSSSNLTVLAPAVGSVQYLSANPKTISLKGTGGFGLQETSRVQFKVVDAAGNPIAGKTVAFTLNTSVGGLALVNASSISDANGIAVADVTSGTVSTPVRVTASVTTAAGAVLLTQSDQLVISTGIPDQTSFSLSASIHNLEGWGYDGITTTITARLADHFNNPVPDGTAVTFTAEGGKIEPSCVTTNGECSVVWNSQNPRPSNGRVTVLAYAVGEESFVDRDGSGYVSSTLGTELTDINLVSTDIGEAYVDFNENKVHDAVEPFIDFNSSGGYDAPDTFYNGVLCKQGVAAECPVGTPRSIHVRGSQIIVFSDSSSTFRTATSQVPEIEPLNVTPYASINLNLSTVGVDTNPVDPYTTTRLAGCGAAQTYRFLIADTNRNEMPIGTTVTVTTDNGTLVGPTSFVVGDSIRSYAVGTYNYSFSIKGDGAFTAAPGAPGTATASATCKDSTASGILTIEVSTPKGSVTLYQIPIIN